jgi:hypothetical protein
MCHAILTKIQTTRRIFCHRAHPTLRIGHTTRGFHHHRIKNRGGTKKHLSHERHSFGVRPRKRDPEDDFPLHRF